MTLPSKSLISFVAIAFVATVIAACGERSEAPTPPLEPRAITQLPRASRVAGVDSVHPVVALVLGGGGLRGFAHVGVLRALEELRVRPDLIVGTSAGAVVGAAYASGLSAEQVRGAALDVRIASLVDLTMSTHGLIRGQHLARWINDLTGGIPIERFPTRFAAVATDLESGRAVLLDAGSPGRVVQASAAVPGINVPVPYADGHLIDGGASSLIPVTIARAMGADIVIAVDIYCASSRPEGTGSATVIRNVMHLQSCRLAALEVEGADLIITPHLATQKVSSMQTKEAAMRAGYDAACEAVRAWRRLELPGSGEGDVDSSPAWRDGLRPEGEHQSRKTGGSGCCCRAPT